MKTSHFARGITPEQKKCSKSSLIYLLCELNLLLMVHRSNSILDIILLMVYLFFLAGGWDGAYPCHMDTFFHFFKIRLNTCDAILQI
jgi:hypothetical protein